MKLKCEVLAVETCGDTMEVRLQGRGPRDADWRPWAAQSLRIALTESARKAFIIGRKVEITVTPK